MYRWYYKVLFIAALVPFLVFAGAVSDGKVKKEKDDVSAVKLFKGGKYSVNANKVAGDTLFFDDFFIGQVFVSGISPKNLAGKFVHFFG